VALDGGRDLGRADQQELVAVALNRQLQRLVSRR
jgi:hypothetical protein